MESALGSAAKAKLGVRSGTSGSSKPAKDCRRAVDFVRIFLGGLVVVVVIAFGERL